MPATYSQLLVHVVFSTYQRLPLIPEPSRVEIEKYITGLIANKDCRLLAIYLNPDHAHILVGLHPDVAVSALVKDIKVASTKFINSNRLSKGKFQWQEGYGAFTHSRSQIDQVVNYILTQPERHKRFNFADEYRKMLVDFGVDFHPEYLFVDRG